MNNEIILRGGPLDGVTYQDPGPGSYIRLLVDEDHWEWASISYVSANESDETGRRIFKYEEAAVS